MGTQTTGPKTFNVGVQKWGPYCQNSYSQTDPPHPGDNRGTQTDNLGVDKACQTGRWIAGTTTMAHHRDRCNQQ